MIFYSVVAIILGLVLIIYGIKLNISKANLKSIPIYIIALMYVGVGVYGFFINQDYDWAIILALIVICIITLVIFGVLFKKDQITKH